MSDQAYHVITQHLIFPPQIDTYNTRERLIGALGDCLTCHVCIYGIWQVDSGWLTRHEIQALEKEALKGLSGISKAKAMGIFP